MMRMMKPETAIILCSLLLGACAPTQVFSPEAMEGVDKNFDFSAWRMVPNGKARQKIQLGGRIIQAESKEGAVVIVVAQLPIVEHPAYGPKDNGKRSGEFVVIHQGTLGTNALQPGNRLVVVGTTQNAKVVTVDDIQRSLPTVVSRCLHIWNTGGREVADFPSFGGGYQPLEENTFCAKVP
ncbi:MAG: Slp family lipoprotein [Nitrospiraceae bacterium]